MKFWNWLVRIWNWIFHRHSQPKTIYIRFNDLGENMPVTLLVGQSVNATAVELDSTGANFPVVAADITWATTGSATSVVANADGTATYTATAVGTDTATVTDTVYNLTASDTITVNAVPDVPVSISISWGTPA